LSRKRKKRPVKTQTIEVTEPERTADSRSDSERESKPTDKPRSYRVFATALISLALLWLSFPPVGLFWLAWLAPLPLVWLVQDESLSGRRPYRQLFFAGLLYWLATFYFIPIPHPALWAAWIAVSIYMAFYTPLLIGISRALVHRFSVPSLLAVPIVWTGIEWIRCNFATGMAMVCLSHTQYKVPIMIQVADLFGAYTLTFAMILFAVGVASVAKMVGKRRRNSEQMSLARGVASVAVSFLVLAAVLLYGRYRLNEPIQFKNDSSLKVGLIQSSNDVVFRALSEDEWMKQLVDKYELTWKSRRQWNDLDLIVWPESGFSPYVDLIADVDQEHTVQRVADVRTQVWSDAVGYPDHFPTPIPLLTGGGTFDPKKDQQFASAFLIANDGQIETRYFKNHLVMIGEYVPFSDWFPIIEKISPIGGGITAGDKFETITRNDINVAPSICFETTIPHYIRRQINSLAEAGTEPDVMVNMTNDGWFYGTSCLDLHLACNVFRAVEMRKPHLVCANTGLSAEIDSCGRLIQVSPRRAPAVIRAEVKPIVRTSLYRQFGDLVPILFAAITILAGLLGWLRK
jgi:apolipoprotein N-acyltransferase